MFNNPFDSFHNTVAEAKEEREQLDRLLTISTPRERMLVGVIALLLILLAAWLFLGSVARTVTVDGVLIEPREPPVEASRSVQALVWIGEDVASRIEPGMSAVIELTLEGGVAGTSHGIVARISAVPLSEGLAEFASAAPVSVHRVIIALDESLRLASLADMADMADMKCRIVIELGRQSPAALFGMKRS